MLEINTLENFVTTTLEESEERKPFCIENQQ
jgi:hypothetical protein